MTELESYQSLGLEIKHFRRARVSHESPSLRYVREVLHRRVEKKIWMRKRNDGEDLPLKICLEFFFYFISITATPRAFAIP